MSFSMEDCPRCGSENTEYDWHNKENHCRKCGHDWECGYGWKDGDDWE